MCAGAELLHAGSMSPVCHSCGHHRTDTMGAVLTASALQDVPLLLAMLPSAAASSGVQWPSHPCRKLPLQLHHSHPMPLMAQASGVVQCTGKKVHFDEHAAIVSVCMLTFSGAHVM